MSICLSPFTNYTIRRMLHEHVESLTDIQAHSLRVSETVNLDRLLLKLYPKKFIATAKFHDLEMLTVLYQKASANRSANLQGQVELRRRIFHILGIRFGVNETFMPPIIPETAESLFQFYNNGEMRDGLCLDGKMYGKVQTATMPQRQELDEIALMFSEQKISCVITVTADHYSMWILLRSPAYAVYLKQGLVPLKKALTLHSSLCRFKQAKLAA
ncbi:MAG: hypothetical protein LH679_03940 [Cyanobacteria bacterium CAN_BIN43]|nr:hypothetical protein [Cyanobacteria bacterium CAN_BIN43]